MSFTDQASRSIEDVISADELLKQAGAKAEEGDYVGAIQRYTEAILLNPNFARAYGNRGLVRANLGDKRGAMEDWRRAAELFRAQRSMANYEMVLGYMSKIEQR